MSKINHIVSILCLVVSVACQPHPEIFRLEGDFTDEQVVLIERAQEAWCNVGTQFGKSDSFCTELGEDGNSVFVAKDDLTKYYGTHQTISINADEPQWGSRIILDNRLDPWLFYHVTKHELGHHFCIKHTSNNGLMEPIAADSDDSDITEEMITNGGCRVMR